MTDRIAQGLQWLAAEISAEREEFGRENQPDGAALLEGLVSHGYAMEQGGRFGVSPAGFRRLEAAQQ